VRSQPSWFALLLFPAVVIVGAILVMWVGTGLILFLCLFALVFIAVAMWQTLRR
jgi:hypothetical protein